MPSQPKPLHVVFDSNNTLSKLQQHSQHLQQLTEIVRRHLPATAASHLQACSCQDATLTLYAGNAAQATVLRLASGHLLQSLDHNQHLDPAQKRLFKQLRRIQIRISSMQQGLSTKTSQPTALANNTAALLSELAETIIDPAIKNILKRLSRRRTGQETKSIQ